MPPHGPHHPPHGPHGHHHLPHHGPAHHRRLSIGATSAARGVAVLTEFFGTRTATMIFNMAVGGASEPAAHTMVALLTMEHLAAAVRMRAPGSLAEIGAGVIDPESSMYGGPRLAESAIENLRDAYPQEASFIEFSLSDGPVEMLALAIVHAINLRLAAELARATEQPPVA